MNSGIFKYIVICCFALTLLFKASGVLSVFKKSINQIEYSESNEDSTEKEVETESFDVNPIAYQSLKPPVLLPVKVLLPLNFFISTYFPEVLTPPPSSLV